MIEGLYEIKSKDKEKFFNTLIDAFHDYPKLKISFPTERKRLIGVELTVRFYGAYDLKYGNIYAIDENVNEAIAIVDSEEVRYTFLRELIAGCYSAEFCRKRKELDKCELKKMKGFFEELDRLERSLNIPKKHIYIDFLGVKREMQGRGRGKKLLEKISLYSQKKNRPLMLFTNTKEDIDFYKREGFKVIGVTESLKYGFVNTYMIKEPYCE